MPLTCVLLGHSILLAAGQSCEFTRRDGNKWSSHFCRRQWSLVDNATLRYQQLNAFDAALQRLDQKYSVMSSPHLLVSHDGSANKEPQQVSGMLALLALLACLPACLPAWECQGAPAHKPSPGLRVVAGLQVIVAERGPLLLVINLSPTRDLADMKVLPRSARQLSFRLKECRMDQP